MKRLDTIRNFTRLCGWMLIVLSGVGCGRGFQGLNALESTPALYATGVESAAAFQGPACQVFQGAANLKYFGFFCSSCDWVGNGSYTDEVKDFSNTVFVASGSHSDTYFQTELQKAKDAGMFAIVSVTNFNIGYSPGPQGDFDYWWNKHLPTLKPFVEDGTIIAFYVSDDAAPVDLFDSTYRKIKSSFTKPVKLMSIVMPGVPYDDYAQKHLSAEVDWIGFETYSYATPEYFDYAKKNFLKPHQQIVLVPGVFYQSRPYPWGGTMASIDATLAEATNNPRVVAVIPFLWSDGPGLTGARSIPDFKSKVEQLGACFPKGTELQDRVNWALASRGSLARASSTYLDFGHFSAAAAHDGRRGALRWPDEGGWNSLRDPSPQNPEWLEVDLGSPRLIDELQIYSLADSYNSNGTPQLTESAQNFGLMDFELQYHNGSSWVTPAGGNILNHSQVGARVQMAPVQTSKVRVLITRARAGWARVVELEAWGPRATTNSGLTNFAAARNGATVVASTTVQVQGMDFSPSGVNDEEKLGLRWAHGGGWNSAAEPTLAAPQWIEVRLGQRRSVSEVRVMTLQDQFDAPTAAGLAGEFTRYGVTDFEIQAWVSGQWVTVPGGRLVQNRKVQVSVPFAAVTTDRIRVWITGGLGGYARITEIEALGPGESSASNVALATSGATIRASSTIVVAGKDFGAGSVINGDRSGTNWEQGGGWNSSGIPSIQSPQWIEVTFASAKTLSMIKVFTLQDQYTNPTEPDSNLTFANFGVEDFDLEYWNGSTWLTVPGGAIRHNDRVQVEIPLSGLVTQKIRVSVTRARGGYARITEVEAFGN